MPRLSFWSVRFSLAYLLVGFTFGALMLANKGTPLAPWIWKLLPIHIVFLIFGFIAQLVMGVEFWILPRFAGGSRGSESLGWLAIVCLNLGIWVSAIQAWFGLAGAVLQAGRVLLALAGVVFVFNVWKRVKPTYPA